MEIKYNLSVIQMKLKPKTKQNSPQFKIFDMWYTCTYANKMQTWRLIYSQKITRINVDTET